MRSWSTLLLLAAGCGAAHRASESPEPLDAPRDPFAGVGAFANQVANRGALPPVDDPFGDSASEVRYLDQGWGPIETLWYYYADQGSRLMPRRMLLALERADGSGKLAAPEVFARYRFLAQASSPNNPDALPVGVVSDGESVGMTCAACHTGQVVYNGVAVRVDGAPALIDMVGWIDEVRDAVQATLADGARLQRYYAAIGAEGEEEAEAKLELERTALFLSTWTANLTEVRGGYGRVDAIGAIINQVIRFTAGTGGSVQANAPTSYPLLWDAPRHDYVQWTGFSSNAAFGSLGRNVGEVVGVFGDVHLTGAHDAKENEAGVTSSVRTEHLVDMEETLWRLQSPAWPADLLGAIDAAKAERGAALYGEACASCHDLIVRDDPARRVTARITGVDVVGTDATSADNLIGARIPTGVLEGSLTPDGKGYFGTEDSGLNVLVGVGGGILKQNKVAVLRTLANAKRWGLEDSPKQGQHTPDSPDDPTASLRSYKARPLNGVWASAPYLHNGSVPTLYDLLLPEDQRPARFAVGRWTYDPVKVGYVSEGDAPWVLDTTVPGNRNTGHTYGTTLGEEDRLALVEYLKTL